MRATILEKLQAISEAGFTVSTVLPYDQGDTPLYLQNIKTIYVDLPQTEQDPLVSTLDGNGVYNEVLTVNAIVGTDAKTLPSNYDSLISSMKAVALDDTVNGFNRKPVAVSTAYEGDIVITTVSYSFVKTQLDT